LRENTFNSCGFDIALMTEQGEWIKGTHDDKFLSSLVIGDTTLKAGGYVIIVSPRWNDESN